MKLRKIGKKGALDVSINAIVVIIFAITMLGLGLAFMKGTFGKIGSQVDKSLDSGTLAVMPTADNPIVVLPSDSQLSKGKTESFDLGIYNDDSDGVTIIPIIKCTPNDLAFNGKILAAPADSVAMPPNQPIIAFSLSPRTNQKLGSVATWTFKISPTVSGVKVCTVFEKIEIGQTQTVSPNAKDFIIEVK